MPLESALHINDLVPTNPAGTDNRIQGDEHLRMLKQVLKTDLPLTAPATAIGLALLTSLTPKYITSTHAQTIASATWVTLITFPSAAPATWLVSFNLGATGDTANYGTTVLVMTDTGAATRVVLQSGALLTTQMSGLALQAQQGSGGTQTINATATRIA